MFNSRGFTLIEVLVSMVILAVGLLGLAAMQAVSLRDNLDAYYYQQATLLAYEMQDKIQGNVDGGVDWVTLSQSIDKTSTDDACFDNPCTAQQIAQNDLNYWYRRVKATLPTPKDESTEIVEIQSSSPDSIFKNNPRGGCRGSYATSLCLIVKWGRSNDKNTVTFAEDSSFYLEVTTP